MPPLAVPPEWLPPAPAPAAPAALGGSIVADPPQEAVNRGDIESAPAKNKNGNDFITRSRSTFCALTHHLDHARKLVNCARAVPFKRVIAGSLIALGVASAACRNAPKPSGLVLGPPEVALALAGLNRQRPIPARLETSEGTIHCTLDAQRAPRSVALFVGLALGRANFRDLRSGSTVSRPFYRDQVFFRAIPNLLVQSGCPVGNGTGTPGYRIAVEPSGDDAQRLAQPGALFLARYHAPPNRVDPNPPPPGDVIGSQFVISLGSMSHLAGEVSVLGVCEDLDRVRAMTSVVASGAHPVRLTQVVVGAANDAD